MDREEKPVVAILNGILHAKIIIDFIKVSLVSKSFLMNLSHIEQGIFQFQQNQDA